MSLGLFLPCAVINPPPTTFIIQPYMRTNEQAQMKHFNELPVNYASVNITLGQVPRIEIGHYQR